MLHRDKVSAHRYDKAFTLIELLVVIAIIAILAVVVILTLNPAELLRQSRDSSRVSDMATLTDALNLYTTDQTGASSFSLGNASDTYPSIYDPSATSTAGDQCQGLGMVSLSTSTGQAWQCSASTTYRSINNQGWIPVNLNNISAGSPIGSLPVDPINQTSTGLFYVYNTNGSQFEVTSNLESNKYHLQYGNSLQTPYFPDVISGGTPTVSALYNPTGLVGYWNLSEGSNTIAFDTSGNGNNGTWNGSTTNSSYYTGGIVGSYAGEFNGVNDYVNIATSSIWAPTTGLTVSAWVDPSSLPNPASRVVGNFTSGGLGYALSPAVGTPRLLLGNGSITTLSGSSNTLIINSWQLLTGTWDGTTAKLYLNGTFQTSTAFTGLAYSATAPLLISRDALNSQYFFAGSINDVRIYNRALSAAEIKALYTAEY